MKNNFYKLKKNIKSKIKKSYFYFSIRKVVIKSPFLYQKQKQFRFSLKLQYTFITRAKTKALIMIFCSFIAIFFAFCSSVIPSISDSFKNAENSGFSPYKSYTNFSEISGYASSFDPYIYGYPEKFPGKSQIVSNNVDGQIVPRINFQDPVNSFSPETFDYTDYRSYSMSLLGEKNIVDIPGLSGLYKLDPIDKNNESLHTELSCSSFIGSLLAAFYIEGVGGECLDVDTLNALRFLDDYSWYEYSVNKDNLLKLDYCAAWKLSRQFAKTVAKALINGPIKGNSAATAIFAPFLSNSDDDNINLSISSCLSDVFFYFAPYAIKVNMGSEYKFIDDDYKSAYNLSKKDKSVQMITRTYLYYRNFNKQHHNQTYLSLGAIPFSQANGDELFSQYHAYKSDGSEINIEGIDYDSAVWKGENEKEREELQNEDAFVNLVNCTKLHDGLYTQTAIPIIANETAIKKYHYHVGQYIFTNLNRMAYYDTDVENNKLINAKWNQKTVFHIIGSSNNLGLSEFYTSRQECNALILSTPKTTYNSTKNSLTVGDEQVEKNNPYIYQNITAVSTANNELGGMTKDSAAYGDGNGYFNSVLYKNSYNPSDVGLSLNSTWNYSLTGPLNINTALIRTFSGNVAQMTVDNITQFFLMYGYVISFILLLLSIVLFILSQRIILVSNKRNIQTLKTLGYSNLYIQYIVSSIYIYLGMVFSVCLLFFYRYISQMILNAFGSVLTYNGYIPIEAISISIVAIYFAVIFFYYLVFIIFAKRGVNKAKLLDRSEY